MVIPQQAKVLSAVKLSLSTRSLSEAKIETGPKTPALSFGRVAVGWYEVGMGVGVRN